MKWHLDDTTSDGIRFLLIGAGSLFVLRLVYAGVQHLLLAPLTTDLAACIATFGNGYLLADSTTVVSGGMLVGERLALALVLMVVCTVLVGLIVAMVAKALGKAPTQAAVASARVMLIASGLWWCYAALFAPPRLVRITSDGLQRQQRPAVFGELSLPWIATETMVPWSAVDRVEARGAENGSDIDRSHVVVEAFHGEGRLLITTTADTSHATRLAELITTEHIGHFRD